MLSVFFVDEQSIATKLTNLPDETTCVKRAAAKGAASFKINDGPPCYFGTIYNVAEISALESDLFSRKGIEKQQLTERLQEPGRTYAVRTLTGCWLVPTMPGQKIFDEATQLPLLAVGKDGAHVFMPAPERPPADLNPQRASWLSHRLL